MKKEQEITITLSEYQRMQNVIKAASEHIRHLEKAILAVHHAVISSSGHAYYEARRDWIANEDLQVEDN